jgi:hypothetical protein
MTETPSAMERNENNLMHNKNYETNPTNTAAKLKNAVSGVQLSANKQP